MLGVKLLDNATSAAQLIEMIKFLALPAFLIFLAIAFAPSWRELIKRITSGKVNLKTGEFSFDAQAKAVDETLKATAEKHRAENAVLPTAKAILPEPSRPDFSYADIRARINERTHALFASSRILWVDDNPSNNEGEMAALRALEITIDTVTSTDDALAALGSERYDVVVTDMGRPGDAEAGFTLGRAIRTGGQTLPVIVYTAPSHVRAIRGEASQNGVWFVTADPYELFEAVTNALIQGQAAPTGSRP